jgi:hypothetical protein
MPTVYHCIDMGSESYSKLSPNLDLVTYHIPESQRQLQSTSKLERRNAHVVCEQDTKHHHRNPIAHCRSSSHCKFMQFVSIKGISM